MHVNVPNTRCKAKHEHLQTLTAYIINNWPQKKVEVKQDIQPYYIFCDDLVIIDQSVLKGKRIIIPMLLKQEPLEQLYRPDMGRENVSTSM